MNLDEQLKLYQKERRIEPREECIQRTIEASRECFFRSEAEKMLPYHSFLYNKKFKNHEFYVYFREIF